MFFFDSERKKRIRLSASTGTQGQGMFGMKGILKKNNKKSPTITSSGRLNRKRTNKTTKKVLINTHILCTPDTNMSSSSLCFSTPSSSCHLDNDGSGDGGDGLVSPVRPRALKFEDDDDDDDNDNDEENECLEEAIISPINFILLAILIPFIYNRSASPSSLYGFSFRTNNNSLSNSNSNSDNGMFVTNAIPSGNTEGTIASSSSAGFDNSVGHSENDNVGTTTPKKSRVETETDTSKSILTPPLPNTATVTTTVTTFFEDEEMEMIAMEKKETQIIDPPVTKKSVAKAMAVDEGKHNIPATKTTTTNKKNTNRSNNNNRTSSISQAATTESFIVDADADADADAATAFNTTLRTVTVATTNTTTTTNNSNSNTSTEQIQTQKQTNVNVVVLTTTTAAAAAAVDPPHIVTPPLTLKARPEKASASASSILVERNDGVEDTVTGMITKTTAAAAAAATTTTTNSNHTTQKNHDVVVDDAKVGVVESIISTTALADIPRRVPLPISELLSTSEHNAVTINNNNNNNATAIDNTNKSNTVGVAIDTTSNTNTNMNTNMNPTAFATVPVQKVQFFSGTSGVRFFHPTSMASHLPSRDTPVPTIVSFGDTTS